MADPVPLIPTSRLETLIRCARREVGMRERVYPGQVAAGRMTQARADQELAEMRGILSLLTGLQHHLPSLRRALTDLDKLVE